MAEREPGVDDKARIVGAAMPQQRELAPDRVSPRARAHRCRRPVRRCRTSVTALRRPSAQALPHRRCQQLPAARARDRASFDCEGPERPRDPHRSITTQSPGSSREAPLELVHRRRRLDPARGIELRRQRSARRGRAAAPHRSCGEPCTRRRAPCASSCGAMRGSANSTASDHQDRHDQRRSTSSTHDRGPRRRLAVHASATSSANAGMTGEHVGRQDVAGRREENRRGEQPQPQIRAPAVVRREPACEHVRRSSGCQPDPCGGPRQRRRDEKSQIMPRGRACAVPNMSPFHPLSV